MNIFNNKLNLNKPNLLVSKNIDNYFSNLILKPDSAPKIVKNQYTFEKFYTDYIEHNLLLIIILIGSIVFLIFKYCSKTESESPTDENFDKTEKNNKPNEKLLLKEKKLNQQLKLVKKYKIKLDDEKNKILNIIDELSSMNYEDSIKLNNKMQRESNIKSSINTKPSINTLIDDISNNNYYVIDKKFNEKNNFVDGIYIQPPYIN